MSSESLSQNEIDELFSGGDAPEQAAEAATRDEPDVQVYDFRRPSRISKDRQRSLDAIYGLLATSLEAWLTARLREQVQTELEGVDQISFGEFVLSLPNPCSSYIFDITTTSNQQAIVAMGQKLAFYCVDRLLGGSGEPAFRNRSLTPLEQRVVRIVARKISRQLTEVWEDHVDLEFEHSGFESIPDMLQIVHREDPVLVANIRIQAADWDSLILVCLPFSVLEKFFTGAGRQRVQSSNVSEEQRRKNRRQIETRLRTTRVGVSVRFPEFELPLRTLASLEVGEVLRTDVLTDENVEIYVSGQKRFVGTAGRHGRTLAARIEDVVPVEESEQISILAKKGFRP